jgi:hypothetical protein
MDPTRCAGVKLGLGQSDLHAGAGGLDSEQLNCFSGKVVEWQIELGNRLGVPGTKLEIQLGKIGARWGGWRFW